MRYLLKEEAKKMIREKYKNSYLAEELGLCTSYISMILNGNKFLKKDIAYLLTKTINDNLEIKDLFDEID